MKSKAIEQERARLLGAYQQACEVVPSQRDNHLSYYAQEWARQFGVSEKAGRAALSQGSDA